MKIITLNTHSLADGNAEYNASVIADAIYDIKPHAVCMQEVNQTVEADILNTDTDVGVFPLKADNFGIEIKNQLIKKGLPYEYIWCGFKIAYGRFEEGLGILSKVKADSCEAFYISKSREVSNFKTRMVLGIECGNNSFYSVHTGRWDDTEEPFSGQWKALQKGMSERKNVWLCGDFNCPFNGEGYKDIIGSGWYDCYTAAAEKDEGYTVNKAIDGWKENNSKMRIDYIFSDTVRKIKKCETIFNGINYPTVSDHYGVAVEI